MLVFVVGIDIVEYRELWTNKIGEMSEFNVTHVHSNEELVMTHKCSKPVVVFPTTHSGDSGDGSNVGTEEDKTSSGSAEGFVMWGDLLRSSGGHQVLHEVHGGHVDWGTSGVVWMHVTGFHVSQSGWVVVVGAVFSLVLWLLPIDLKRKIRHIKMSLKTYFFGGTFVRVSILDS